MLRNVLLLILFLIFNKIVAAQEQSYVREYRYHAGDMDSRVTSRDNALKLLKAELLQEVASYVKSTSDFVRREGNSVFTSDFQHTATVISAGYVRVSVLDERWDGREYWVKARLYIDPEKVAEALRKEIERDRNDQSTSNEEHVPQAASPVKSEANPSMQMAPQTSVPVTRKDYLRALFANSFALVAPLRGRIIEHYSFSGSWPTSMEELGLSKGQMTDGETITSVGVESNGALRVRLNEIFGKNKEYVLFPESIMGGTSFKFHCLTNVNLGNDLISSRMCKYIDENTIEIADSHR